MVTWEDLIKGGQDLLNEGGKVLEQGYNKVVDTAESVVEGAQDVAEQFWDTYQKINDQSNEFINGVQTAVLNGDWDEIGQMFGITEPEDMQLTEPEAEASVLEAVNWDDAFSVIQAAKTDYQNADYQSLANNFLDTVQGSSDEDLSESAIYAFAQLINDATPAVQQEIRQIVGDKAYDALSQVLGDINPAEIAAQYLNKLIAGETVESDTASIVMSVLLSRLSSSEREMFIDGLATVAMGADLAKDKASAAVIGALWAISDNNLKGSFSTWFTEVNGVPYTVVHLGPAVVAIADTPVKGLDVRVFTTKEGAVGDKVVGKLTSRIAARSNPVSQITRIVWRELKGASLANAIDQRLDDSLLNSILEKLTHAGLAWAKEAVKKALTSVFDGGDPSSAEPESTPDAEELDDETDSLLDMSALSRQPGGLLKQRRIEPEETEQTMGAYQRAQARRARTLSLSEASESVKRR